MCFDYETADCWQERIVKGRKDYKCSACRAPIVKGEQQLYQSSILDSEVCESRVCRRCCYDMLRVVLHELEEGCDWGEAWPAPQELQEYLHESGLGVTQPADVPSWFELAQGWPHKLMEAVRAFLAIPEAAAAMERELYLIPGTPDSPGQQYLFE